MPLKPAAALLAVVFVVGCAGQPAVGEPGQPSQPATTGAPSTSASAPVATGQPTDAPATPTPERTPGSTVPRVPPLQPPAYASRVVVEQLGIDLPVVSGDLQPPPNYPFCDVASYLTRFDQPYDEPGFTYISAHAQRGMFLPLLQASERNDGASLVGADVAVYVSDGRRFDYQVTRVVRHATDYAALAELALDQRWLVLQTSEGPFGTLEKLQVIAAYQSSSMVDPAQAAPEPHPRDCRPDPEPTAAP